MGGWIDVGLWELLDGGINRERERWIDVVGFMEECGGMHGRIARSLDNGIGWRNKLKHCGRLDGVA